MTQEYMNLTDVIFDFTTTDMLDVAKKQEIRLLLEDLKNQACLYPASFDVIPELILKMGLENRKFKLSFFHKDDVLYTTPYDFIISLSPYVGSIREYTDICNSYQEALIHDNSTAIETIDMARRGLHNQAADFMQSRFQNKIHGNHQAFRVLFSIMTLVF